jgi:hypothetical protein
MTKHIRYFQDILANTPKSVDSVTIHPDGTWSADTSSGKDTSSSDSDADSDDIIEITDSRAINSTLGGGTPRSLVQTPSSSTSTGPSRGQKRPQPEVIDLTLSDDDSPAPKRPNPGGNLAFNYNQSNAPQLPGFRPGSSSLALSFNVPTPKAVSRIPYMGGNGSNSFRPWSPNTPLPQQHQKQPVTGYLPGISWGPAPGSGHATTPPTYSDNPS